MWVPRYITSRLLKTPIKNISKPRLFPFPRTTCQTYKLSNALPHLESTNSISKDYNIQILMHHPLITHPNNVTLYQNGSKTLLMPPFFDLERLTESMVLCSMIRTSNGPSNLGAQKIMQQYLFKTSTRINMI